MSSISPQALQLIADFEEMSMLTRDGLYIFPDSLDLGIWHGVIFVQSGRYAGGTFRFIVCSHPLYPADGARPLVVFLDRPYHPLVDPLTGALQIESRYSSWRGGIDRLPPVVELLREVLTSDLVLVPPSGKAYNAEAARLYRADSADFDARAQKSALAAAASAIRRAPVLNPRGLGGNRNYAASGSGGSSLAAMLTGSGGSSSSGGGAGSFGGEQQTVEVAGVEYGYEGSADNRYLWEKSPYNSPAVHLLNASGTLSTDGQRIATLAASIGKARGFRMAEPSPLHDALLGEIHSAGAASGATGAGGGAASSPSSSSSSSSASAGEARTGPLAALKRAQDMASMLTTAALPSFLEEMKLEMEDRVLRAAAEDARRARASTVFTPATTAGGESRRRRNDDDDDNEAGEGTEQSAFPIAKATKEDEGSAPVAAPSAEQGEEEKTAAGQG